MSNFGAYYRVDPLHPRVLLGKEYENVTPVGEGVSYFLMDKDLRDDQPDGTHGMSFDLSQIDADMLGQAPFIAALMFGMPADLSALLPSVARLVQADIDEGLTGEEILERRAAILIPQFIGFTIDEVKLSDVYHEVDGEDVEKVGNISRCSWEEF